MLVKSIAPNEHTYIASIEMLTNISLNYSTKETFLFQCFMSVLARGYVPHDHDLLDRIPRGHVAR